MSQPFSTHAAFNSDVDQRFGTILLAWLCSPMFIFMITEGLQEGYLCGGVGPEDKTRLVYVSTERLDTFLPRYQVVVHPEGKPDELITMPVSSDSVKDAEKTGFLAAYRTQLESPKYVSRRQWEAAQRIFVVPGNLEISWKGLFGLAALVFVQLTYFVSVFGGRGSRQEELEAEKKAEHFEILIAVVIAFVFLFFSTRLLWQSAKLQGYIAFNAQRGNPQTLVVEKMTESKKLGIFPDNGAFGRLEESGIEGRVKLYAKQFAVMKPGDRVSVVFTGLKDPRFALPESVPPKDQVVLIGRTPLYKDKLLSLAFMWSLISLVFVLVGSAYLKSKRTPVLPDAERNAAMNRPAERKTEWRRSKYR